jgi:hypothetical protein
MHRCTVCIWKMFVLCLNTLFYPCFNRH